MKCLRRKMIYFISLSALAENFTMCYVVFHRLHSKQFHGAVDVWKRNFNHVEHLFDYGSAVRKVMCTTNAVESINSSFRKVTKRVLFQMKCTTQIALFTHNRALQKVEWQ